MTMGSAEKGTLEQIIEEIEFLARSSFRVQLLELLKERGARTKPELREEIDSSRTTLSRNLDALEDHGWIEHSTNGYSLTSAGELVLEDFLTMLETMQVVFDLKEVLQYLPLHEVDLDLDALDDAEVTIPSPDNPYAPINRHIDLMISSEQLQCILPAIGLQPMIIAHDCVINRGHEHEIIIEGSIEETLRTDPQYRPLLNDLLESERCEYYVYEDEVHFYLGIGSTTVQIGVEDEHGVPRGIIEVDSNEAKEWAERTYTKYKQRAIPFT